MKYPWFFFKKLVNDKITFADFLLYLDMVLNWNLVFKFSLPYLFQIKGYNDANEING